MQPKVVTLLYIIILIIDAVTCKMNLNKFIYFYTVGWFNLVSKNDYISLPKCSREEVESSINKLSYFTFHHWYPTHIARRSRSPPGFCSRTALQCWCPGWTRRCRLDVGEGSSSTGRNAAARRRCPAWHGPGAPASLPAGRRTPSQCTHSGRSTALLFLQEEDVK